MYKKKEEKLKHPVRVLFHPKITFNVIEEIVLRALELLALLEGIVGQLDLLGGQEIERLKQR